MRNNTKISIVVPVYNAEKYIGRCIDSILAQTFPLFELILVNDGSTDNSLEICEKYSEIDSRVVVANQSNSGVSSARNYGIKIAKGDYICFVDADDYVKDNYLEQLYKESQQDDRIDLVLQGRIKKEENVQTDISLGLDKTFFLNEDTAFFEHVNLFRFCSVFSKLFKREIILKNEIRFLKELNHGEDFDFFAKYLCCCNGVHVSTCMNYYYIVNKGSLSSRFSSFENEYSCMSTLSVSLTKLCHCFKNQALEKQVNEFLAYFTAKVLASIYEPPRQEHSVRLTYLKSIDKPFVQRYSDYFFPNTLNNRFFKFLYVNKCYRLFDIVSMKWRRKIEKSSRG